MILRDWIKENNIFEEINKIDDDKILEIIGVDNINSIFRLLYGSREVTPSILEVELDLISLLIYNRYIDTWKVQTIDILVKLGMGVDNETIITEINDGSSLKEVVGKEINNMSAFNELDSSEIDNNESDISEQFENNNNKNVIKTNKSLKALQNQLKYLKDNNLIINICKDVSEVITIGIY